MGSAVQLCCFLAVAILMSVVPLPSAEAAKIFFSVNGATSGALYKESADFACNSSTHILDISGTYPVNGGTFTISPSSSSAGLARITCDESADFLKMINVKITGAVSNVRITIWRTYTGSTAQSTYSVSANGTFSGTLGGSWGGSWLSVRGSVQSFSLGGYTDPSIPPPCTAPITRCPDPTDNSTWVFTSSDPFQGSSSITPPGTRTLQAKFWFTLKSGAILKFTNLNVNFGPPLGPDDDVDEPCEGDTSDSSSEPRSLTPGGLIFVQCIQESDVSLQCIDQGKNCPACMVRQRDGMPADPKSGKKLKDNWIRLKHDNENP